MSKNDATCGLSCETKWIPWKPNRGMTCWVSCKHSDALTLYQQILDPSKLKEFADNNYKFDENGRKFYKCIENTVGKGEIACNEQFLFFPQCFQKTCTSDI